MIRSLNTASLGIRQFQASLDVLANNLANLNTVRPTDEAAFQAKYVVAEAANYGDDRCMAWTTGETQLVLCGGVLRYCW